MNKPEHEQTVLDILKSLKGLEPLKQLFWSELSYDRINQPLSRRNWSQMATNSLAEDPILFAGTGQNNDFNIIYSRLPQDKLLLGQERLVVTQLLKEFPYALFVFSNESQDDWHFVNVKYDSELSKRRMFRRIRVSQQERLRTAAERITMLDIQSMQPDMFGISPLTIQLRQDEAFDVEKVSDEFFDVYRDVFENVEANIVGINDKEELRLYTQRLFNRLMFIAFIQKKGWLKFEGKTDYLDSLWEDYQKHKDNSANFYNDRLKILFFSGLNNSSGVNIIDLNKNGVISKLIGEVPYLNGGLFEEEKIDAEPSISIPDKCFKTILKDLFGRFNFTIMENTPLDVEVAVDPEMLGKIFEKLVNGRHETGSYYTPKTVVSFMCREALKAYLGNYSSLIDKQDVTGLSIPEAREILSKLSAIKVCDPACGSGAYLVGMLHELHQLMRLLDTKSAEINPRDDYQVKLDIIQNNLYGVDLDSFAVNIARLRLWLTLAVEYEGNKPEPLPNLDYKIEVGDSLTAPDPMKGSQQAIIGELSKKIDEKTKEYMRNHQYGEKATLKKEIDQLQSEVASWVHTGVEICGFDWPVRFSGVFAGGGFDVVLANPPYGITCEDPLRFQYFPKIKGEDTQSKDSYGLFIARGLQLLKPGGIFTYIVSDTWRTIRSHRPLRKKITSETQVMHVLDLPPWIFEATVNTCILSAIKIPPSEQNELIAGDLKNLQRGDWSTLEENLNTISAHGPDCSTTTYARYTYFQNVISTYGNLSFFIASPKLYKIMSNNYLTRFGDIGAAVHGISTGNNKKYVRQETGVTGSYPTIEDWMKMPLDEIGRLTDKEKISGINKDWKQLKGCFVPFDKGGESEAKEGWLPNYYVPTQYYINWAKGAISDMKKNIGARWFNQQYFFKRGLTFSISGIYAPTFRLNSAGVFEAKGSGIFCDNLSPELLLGLLCSKIARFQFKSFIKHTVDTSGDDINDFRFPMPDTEKSQQLEKLVKEIVNSQKKEAHYPYYLNEQKEIDDIVYQLYKLSAEDIREVELWYCRRYSTLAEAQGALTEVKNKYSEYLKLCELVMTKGPDYWKSYPILELIAKGEGQGLEFKETLEADAKTGEKHPGVLVESLKTIAAFLNTEGGTLLIGVSDSGEIRGLEKDYKLCNKHDKDGFEQKIRSLLVNRIIPQPIGKVKINFENLENLQMCVINVDKSKDVVHLDGKDIYIRDGNTTRKLEGIVLTNWIKERK